MRNKIKTSVSLNRAILDELDQKRGIISRSTFIELLISYNLKSGGFLPHEDLRVVETHTGDF